VSGALASIGIGSPANASLGKSAKPSPAAANGRAARRSKRGTASMETAQAALLRRSAISAPEEAANASAPRVIIAKLAAERASTFAERTILFKDLGGCA